MNATGRVGLALGITALLMAIGGCGSGASIGSANSPSSQVAYAPAEAQPSTAADYDGPAPAAPPQQAEGAVRGAQKADAAPRKRADVEAEERPGLGTEWGETRISRISTVPFVRADANAPFATASFFYNDEEGARTMANTPGFRRTSAGSSSLAGGVISIGLRDERGNFLGGFAAHGHHYVVGEAGRRYSIVVRNLTDNRLEILLSVDGLDVLDGQGASFSKRGYIVNSRDEVEVDGFRQSVDTVAAFRFGSVRNSYANQRHGDSRNVGVIGIAVFKERETNPFPWTADEVQRRHNADPFPGQFATPP